MKLLSPSTALPLLTASALLLSLPPVQARDAHFGGSSTAKSRRGEKVAFRDSDHRFRLLGNRSEGRGGPKRVEIDLTNQRLRAWEGDRLVMQSRISSGRNNSTPTGRFAASYKAREHYSSLYHNAYMPWSVQVAGDVFVHGYSEVPRHPASHGCIRLPVTGTNPAKRFYEWVDPGTPVRIMH